MSILQVTLSRTELALPDLDLVQPDIYSVEENAMGPGAVVRRRQVVTSPWVRGEQEVHSVKGAMTLPLSVRIYGTTMVQLKTRIGYVARALDQSAFILTITQDAQVDSYACMAADYAPGAGGVWVSPDLRNLHQVLHAQIPRAVTPLSGPI